MKKSLIIIVLFAILSLVICGCSKDDSSQIKIGVIAELTGDIPAVGASCKNAAEMAAAEINDAGLRLSSAIEELSGETQLLTDYTKLSEVVQGNPVKE